ncbi:hypothetical protein [Sagittula salina]|uniref:MYXO-CTERM domain-containing protein n=1 Tax=Sagittula salina TaxID=2820268 RepID=A0A940MPT2_9RHOB|nr:hypothetical protein [Sagittula salina]MBP0482498.1 hypothetical protein [Sagittula salina]
MKTVTLALGGLTLAGQAVAHEAGAHMQPHGAEGWMAFAGVLVALAGLVAWRQR